MVLAAHLFNDLLEIDPSALVWIYRSSQVVDPPSPRYYAGFTAAFGTLCLFGGIKSNANQGTFSDGELRSSEIDLWIVLWIVHLAFIQSVFFF